MTRQQPGRRSFSRVPFPLVLGLSALAPLIALAFSLLIWVLHIRGFPWSGMYLDLILDLSIVFAAGLVSLWIVFRGRPDMPLTLWTCFLVGAFALMLGYPIGTLVGSAALVALLMMRTRSRSEEPS